MAEPLPWSASTLSEFKNCPRQYHEKRVVRSVPWEGTEQQRWGEYVHKAFEDHQRDGLQPDGKPVTELPVDLRMHMPQMMHQHDLRGDLYVELQIALNKKLQPCGFFDKDVWFRSKIDWIKVDTEIARVFDYKTGKVKPDFDQLMLYAIWCFYMWPGVMRVDTFFYWTTNLTDSRKYFTRAELPQLWAKFLPDLKQYRDAFHNDIWQPRQSGLCRGWCPVTSCEFWQPKRVG